MQIGRWPFGPNKGRWYVSMYDEGAAGGAPSEGGGQAERPEPGSDGKYGWALGDTERSPVPEHGRPDRRSMLVAFVVGALAGMVVLGLVWATARYVVTAPDSDQATAIGGTSTTTPAGDGEPSQGDRIAGVPSRMHLCRRADADLTAALQAAAPAMDQWEVHIGAMNKLVVGAITLQQATQFWNQTRVGAKRNLGHFRAAMHDAALAGVDCRAPDGPAQASTKLRACAQRVAHERLALDDARIATGTWATHVRHMEMLRMGHMSAARASRLWLSKWRQGVAELDAYRRAARAVSASGGC
jgi:hypothetical protein